MINEPMTVNKEERSIPDGFEEISLDEFFWREEFKRKKFFMAACRDKYSLQWEYEEME